uniref:Putative WW-binding domain-containing protein n=1 Tax=Bubo bubo TaxID=30461 RepID=A0A8C0FTP9_BUBBB
VQSPIIAQYNSFLYWRAPLPTIDLSDIQNLDGETPPEAKTPSRTDTMETEMETDCRSWQKNFGEVHGIRVFLM